jgi:GNAT superfamily N-acetyltransferase
MPVQIRAYEPSDLASARALWVELVEQHRVIYADPTIGGDDPSREFDAYRTNPNLCGPWLAEVGGNVVGLAGLIVQGQLGEVEPVIVSAGHRRKGVGKALVAHVVEQARQRGVGFLSAKPVARNVDAVSFFVSAGFANVGHVDLFQQLTPPSRTVWKPGLVIHGHQLRY